MCHTVALIIGNCIKWWKKPSYREAGSSKVLVMGIVSHLLTADGHW